MAGAVRAIETTAVVHALDQLRLDTPLSGGISTRVLVLFPEEYEEISKSEWLYAAATNPAFGFLKNPGQDICTLEDGRPFDDKGQNDEICLTCEALA